VVVVWLRICDKMADVTQDGVRMFWPGFVQKTGGAWQEFSVKHAQLTSWWALECRTGRKCTQEKRQSKINVFNSVLKRWVLTSKIRLRGLGGSAHGHA
jgi:hypothetical protein